jgi:hypothetical protein
MGLGYSLLYPYLPKKATHKEKNPYNFCRNFGKDIDNPSPLCNTREREKASPFQDLAVFKPSYPIISLGFVILIER